MKIDKDVLAILNEENAFSYSSDELLTLFKQLIANIETKYKNKIKNKTAEVFKNTADDCYKSKYYTFECPLADNILMAALYNSINDYIRAKRKYAGIAYTLKSGKLLLIDMQMYAKELVKTIADIDAILTSNIQSINWVPTKESAILSAEQIDAKSGMDLFQQPITVVFRGFDRHTNQELYKLELIFSYRSFICNVYKEGNSFIDNQINPTEYADDPFNAKRIVQCILNVIK